MAWEQGESGGKKNYRIHKEYDLSTGDTVAISINGVEQADTILTIAEAVDRIYFDGFAKEL